MGLPGNNVDSDGIEGEPLPLTTLILRVPVLYVYGTWNFTVSADGLATVLAHQ